MQGFISIFKHADILVGELQSVDGYMNIALEKTEEYVGGVKKRSYGDAFVRGNNGEISNYPSLKYAHPLTALSPQSCISQQTPKRPL